MKKVLYSIAAIAISFSSNFVAVNSAQALEEGQYWGGGSRYISITKQASPTGASDRFCYSGFSPNGAMIASLNLKISRYQTGLDYEVYTLQGSNNLGIQQYAMQPDQITFGALEGRFVRGVVYRREESTADTKRSPELQECLNSTEPYFKLISSSGRDRR